MAIPSDGPSEGGGANAVEVQARRQMAKAEEVEGRLQAIEVLTKQLVNTSAHSLQDPILWQIAYHSPWLVRELREALR